LIISKKKRYLWLNLLPSELLVSLSDNHFEFYSIDRSVSKKSSSTPLKERLTEDKGKKL